MNKEEYIREKRKEKFDILWNRNISRFPAVSGSNSKKIKIDAKWKTYYFNKQTTRSGEIYVVCRTGRLVDNDERIEDKMAYSKNDLKEIFSDFIAYKTENKRVLEELGAIQKNLSKYDFERKSEIGKAIRRNKLQEEYAIAFFAYLRWSIKKESEYENFSLEEIKLWIEKCKQEKFFSSRYHIFLDYKISKIKNLFNTSINSILLDRKDSDFVLFCKRNRFNTLFALLALPYYSKCMLSLFEIDTIERIIGEIKTFLDINISYNDYITSSDIEEL